MVGDRFTRWAVVASGEGGGRIATQFFTRSENPGIDDRILVMNTNRNDLRNTINRLDGRLEGDQDDLWATHALEFGSQQGVGNFFPAGAENAHEDIDKIVGQIRRTFDLAEALLYVLTLGGGTGNGSIPYVIDQFKEGLRVDSHEPWMDSIIHVAMAVWPYYTEPPQRHFNAVCGLSRLLMNGNGEQNADLVLLASNSHLSEDDGIGNYDTINELIVEGIDLMIGAGRETHGVIDIEDYVQIPSQFGAYHFTPAVATGLNGDVYELTYMFEKAAAQPFVPLDVETSRVVYPVVRAPEVMIENGTITEPEVYDAFNEWQADNGIQVAGQVSLTPKREPGSDVDVLLLLGGFDLDPLLEHSMDQFENYRQNLMQGRSLGGHGLTESELQAIMDNLEEYRELNEG